MTFALAAPVSRYLDLESFAECAGFHPDFVRRLVVLGLLEPSSGPDGELIFSPHQLAAAARLQRLRRGFALNYAALGLVVELLDRISALEDALRARPPKPTGG